jgi:heterodisulfide reductase subunit A
MYLTKFAHLIKKKLPETHIIDIYSNLCLPGKKSETFLKKLDKENLEFIKVNDTHDINIYKENEKISISYPGLDKIVDVDMVVLAPALEGYHDNEVLSKIMDLSIDKGNFFEEEHAKIAPVSTTSEGIFIAGCAQGPQDVSSSVAQSLAAAGKIISQLIPGEKLLLEPCVSKIIDEENCSGCRTCISVCPYKAITYDEIKKHALINEVLCRGCGVCVVTCPSGLIVGKNFTDEQIIQEIKGVLE